MNKVHKAFSKIKVDDSLKRRTLKHINDKQNTGRISFFNRYIIYVPVAFASVMFVVFLYNFNAPSDMNGAFNLDYEEAITSDSLSADERVIFYNNEEYVFDENSFDEFILDKKIGILKQFEFEVDENSEANFYSNYYEGSKVYSLKNVNNYDKLAVVVDGEILIFKKVIYDIFD